MSAHVRMPKLRRAGGLKPLLPKDVSKWMKVVQVESAVNSPWSKNGCGWIFIDWDYFHWGFLWFTTGKMKLMVFFLRLFCPMLVPWSSNLAWKLVANKANCWFLIKFFGNNDGTFKKKLGILCFSLSLYSTSAVSVPRVCFGGYINCPMLKLHHEV